ncbi:YcxB family protein [Streptomyces sp. WAC07061]|uniref:YcxB family protein n=1 Tax=Streptomyces sp. WAC07061 TaxID=2487410 RepID=UPI000F7754DD|nr:YcxB family protein [Streptomyces sp. WAC07061]RSS62856.1 YcxB family protein [Streptomyces sp. WAC07061]
MDTTEPAVELRYVAAGRDAWEVLRWRALRTPAGRRGLLLWLVALPAVPVALVAAQHGRAADPAGLAFAGGVGMVLGAVWHCLDLRRRARRMHRWAGEHPEYTCVVTALGTRNHRPDGTAVAHTWDRYRGWAETRSLFVLVFRGGDLGWLPKRAAAAPGDLDRIRSFFDRNLTRIG